MVDWTTWGLCHCPSMKEDFSSTGCELIWHVDAWKRAVEKINRERRQDMDTETRNILWGQTLISIFRQVFPLMQACQMFLFLASVFKRSDVVTLGRKKCQKNVQVHWNVKAWTDILGPYCSVSCLLWLVCISWHLNKGSEYLKQLWNCLLTPSICPLSSLSLPYYLAHH